MPTNLRPGPSPRMPGVALRFGVPVVSTAIALLLTRTFDLSVFPTPLFFAAIVASTWYGSVFSGLLAILLATLMLDYYFIPAPHTFVNTLPHLLQFALPSLLTLWFVAKRREAELSLRAARDELELKVQERTSDLRTEIAERERAEAMVHRTQAQLAHVNRVMTMGELATSIAHELNQPLTAVIVNGDAGLRWLDAPSPNLAEAKAALGRMVAESSRAGEIIKRIRDLSRHSSASRERVDLPGLVKETLALTNGELAANDIAVSSEIPHDLPPVRGDRVQLQQVLLNLVINAVEAMNAQDDAPRELHVSAALHAPDAVVVNVRDSGVGVPEQQLDRIFDAFFTTKPQGVGMGLSISRTIVEAHAGRLWAEPARPGSIFRFTIPTYAAGNA